MKQFLLFTFLLFSVSNFQAQEWISSDGIRANHVRGSYVTSDDSAIITTSIGVSHISYDQGETWSDILGPDGLPFVSSYFVEADAELHNVRVNDAQGIVTVHSSADNGQTWQQTAVEQLYTPWELYGESVHVINDMLYISLDDTLIITDFDLQNPTYVFPGFTEFFFPSQGIRKMVEHQGALYALGTDVPGIWTSSDNGMNWAEPSFSILSAQLGHIETANGKLYMSDDDEILEFDDANQSWITLGAVDLGWSVKSFLVEGDRIIALTDSPDLYISEDHGASWDIIDSFEHFGLPPTTLAYDNVSTFDRIGEHYVVGGFFGTMRADVNDLEFASTLTGHTGDLGLHDLVVVGDRQLGITGNNMKFSSPLGNGTWDYHGSSMIGASGSNITAYRASLIRKDETIYSSSGYLLRSEDIGMSWDTLFDAGVQFAPSGYMDMGFSDDYIFLGTSLGPYRSGDDGATWQNVPDSQANTEALCYKNGELFFADGFAGGDINYSTDNGDTYVSVRGNLQGNVKDIKVAGGSVFVVSSTASWSTQNDVWVMHGRDGNWEQVTQFVTTTNDGSYFDMVECDDVLFVGTRNGQYVTDDAGATWTDITHNLNTLAPFIDIVPREWANDTLYCTGQFKIYKLPFVKEANALTDFDSMIDYDLFPNPVNEQLHIRTDQRFSAIEIVDLSGRRVMAEAAAPGRPIDVSGLRSGSYLLRLVSNETVGVKSFVKN